MGRKAQDETQSFRHPTMEHKIKCLTTSNKGSSKRAMKGKKDKDVYLWKITMIDPTNGWMKNVQC